ncbi:transcription elongation factor GreA [Candidatus Cytomitobacter indipagum]|uniref:Transcription elongation factor GreA n=1 Tax=Candidatus Cytomitobacter indipagum TaxID=2601575 RepID=A0A5C0UEY4_9PROT|nr:transcription elongation factor GreA [Candidatus Cytomitobacter indipagum]QEK38203.1 transcription elongation factor GreA [Candidatus Cytomitobacter indipagum]
MNNYFPITKEGYKKLNDELFELENVKLPKIIEAIQKARALGDLSENAEYKAAKEMQGALESRRSYLRRRIPALRIIDFSNGFDDIRFGATITLCDLDNDAQVSYQLVGEDESDPDSGKISIKSPVGRSCLGRSEGDCFEVITPGGSREYEVIKILYK